MKVQRRPITFDKVYTAQELKCYFVLNTMAGEEVYPPNENILLTDDETGEQFVISKKIFEEDYMEVIDETDILMENLNVS